MKYVNSLHTVVYYTSLRTPNILLYVCMNVFMYVSMYVCMYVCMYYVCMYACMYVRM